MKNIKHLRLRGKNLYKNTIGNLLKSLLISKDYLLLSTGDLDDPIKLAGSIDVEYHTFVSKVIFKITKKKGHMSDMDVADMAKLNEVALKYNTKFAEVYKRLTGNASPVQK